MRYAELFAGAGGFSLGFHRAGWKPAWHAEIDKVGAVLTEHWPDTPLYGDVRELNGKDLVALHGEIDILIGGSPCQDLSVAGKRAGLEGARSGLFFEQMRLWDETGAEMCLWENVVGALSSNQGEDFYAVLRAFIGADFDVPRDKHGKIKWAKAGAVSANGRVAAWRVLDAQFFGVPQRRRRIFVLGTRTGRVDPAEILSLGEGVRGDSPARGEAGEGAAAGAGDGAPITFVLGSDPISRVGGASQPVTGRNGDPGCVLAFNVKQDGADAGTVRPTLLAMPHDQSHANGGGQIGVLAFDTTQVTSPTNRCHPLAAGAHAPLIVPDVLTFTGEGVRHALTHEGHDASEDGTGRGTPIIAWALGSHAGSDGEATNSSHAKGGPVGFGLNEEITPALRSERTQAIVSGIPRRLTPRECERLMGWPDGWTACLGSDAARYKACGNGVVSNVAQWLAEGIAAALRAIDAQEEAA